MKTPSRVSIRLIPAVKRIGRHMMEYQGSDWVASRAVVASRATSVAVSKPMPKTTPTGYICHSLVIDFIHGPKIRYMKPRFSSWLLELGLVVVAVAHLAEHGDDPGQDHDVEEGDQVEEAGRDDGAEDPAELLEPRAVVRHGGVDGLLGDDDARPDGDHDASSGRGRRSSPR